MTRRPFLCGLLLLSVTGCTRTVVPIRVATALAPAAEHLRARGASPPDKTIEVPGSFPYVEPTGKPGRYRVYPSVTLRGDLDLDAGAVTDLRSTFGVHPRGAPEGWAVTGTHMVRETRTGKQYEPLFDTVGTVEILHPPGATWVVVLDATKENKRRVRGCHPVSGEVKWTILGGDDSVHVTDTHAVLFGPETVIVKLETGERVSLPQTEHTIQAAVPVKSDGMLVLYPKSVQLLSLSAGAMAWTVPLVDARSAAWAQVAAPTLPVAPPAAPSKSKKAPPPPRPPVEAQLRLVIVDAKGSATILTDGGNVIASVNVPAGSVTASPAGWVAASNQSVSHVGWDGQVRWTKELPAGFASAGPPQMSTDAEGVTVANTAAIGRLTLASGDVSWSLTVQGAGPTARDALAYANFDGLIDVQQSVEHRKKVARALGMSSDASSVVATVGNGVAGGGMQASAFSSSSLLQSQVIALIGADARSAAYKRILEAYVGAAKTGEQRLIQDEYYVRTLRWFWGEGLLVVRLRDGYWRECVTGPSQDVGVAFGALPPVGLVHDKKLFVGGIGLDTSRWRAPATATGLYQGVPHFLQVWDLSTNLQPPGEYPGRTMVRAEPAP